MCMPVCIHSYIYIYIYICKFINLYEIVYWLTHFLKKLCVVVVTDVDVGSAQDGGGSVAAAAATSLPGLKSQLHPD